MDSLAVNTGTLSCGAALAYPTALSTLSTSAFTGSTPITVTETVGGEPSATGIRVCFAPGSGPTGKALAKCKSVDEGALSEIEIAVRIGTDP